MAKKTGALKQQAYKPNSLLRRLNLIDDFSGGLNTASSSNAIFNNQVREIVNFQVSGVGALSKRPGTLLKKQLKDSLKSDFEEVLGFINVSAVANQDNAKHFYIVKDKKKGITLRKNVDNVLIETPFYVYEENNELFSFDSSGSYIKKDSLNNDDSDPLKWDPLKDGKILGKSGNFQLFNNIVYWKVGTKIFQYPLNGSWEINADGSIRVESATGKPIFVPISKNVGESEETLDTVASKENENQFWVELPKQVISANDLQTKGVNLYSKNPKQRVLNFYNTEARGKNYGFQSFSTPIAGKGEGLIKPRILKYEEIDEIVHLWDRDIVRTWKGIYGGNGQEKKNNDFVDFDESNKLDYNNSPHDIKDVHMSYLQKRELGVEFTSNVGPSKYPYIIGVFSDVNFISPSAGEINGSQISFKNKYQNIIVAGGFPASTSKYAGLLYDGWSGCTAWDSNIGSFIKFDFDTFKSWSGWDLSLDNINRLYLNVQGTSKVGWSVSKSDPNDGVILPSDTPSENKKNPDCKTGDGNCIPYYDNNVAYSSFNIRLKRLEEIMIEARNNPENEDFFNNFNEVTDKFSFWYSRTNIRMVSFIWTYFTGFRSKLTIWPIEFLNANNDGSDGQPITEEWLTCSYFLDPWRYTYLFKPHRFIKTSKKMENPIIEDNSPIEGITFTPKHLNTTNYFAHSYFSSNIITDFFDFKKFINVEGYWGKNIKDKGNTSALFTLLQGDLDGVNDDPGTEQPWYKDIDVDVNIQESWNGTKQLVGDDVNDGLKNITRLIKRHQGTAYVRGLVESSSITDPDDIDIAEKWLEKKGVTITSFSNVGFKVSFRGTWLDAENSFLDLNLVGSIGAVRGKVKFSFNKVPIVSDIYIEDQISLSGEETTFRAVVSGGRASEIFDGENYFSWNIKKINTKVPLTEVNYPLDRKKWTTEEEDSLSLSTTLFEESQFTTYFFRALIVPPPDVKGKETISDGGDWEEAPYNKYKVEIVADLGLASDAITYQQFFDWSLQEVSLDFSVLSKNEFIKNDLIGIDEDLTDYDFLIYNGLMLLYNKDKIWVSDPFNFGYFPKSFLKQLNLGSNEVEREIKAIKYFQNVLVIFTNQDIHILKGTNPVPSGTNPISINKINNSLGAVSGDSIINYNNKIIFMSNRGIYSLVSIAKSIDDNWNVKRIDADIKGIYNYSNWPEAKAILLNDVYYLFLNGKKGESSTWLIYSEQNNSNWSTCKGLNFDVVHPWILNGRLNYARQWTPDVIQFGYSYYKTTSEQGKLSDRAVPEIWPKEHTADSLSPGYKDNVQLWDNGKVKETGLLVDSYFKTKAYDFGEPLHWKKYKEIQVVTEGFSEPTKFTYDVLVDGVSIVDQEIWEYKRTDASGRSEWIITKNDKAIGTIRGYTNLGTTLFYDHVEYREDITTNKNRFRINARGRQILIKIHHNENNPLQISSLGLVFKLKKAK